MEIESDSDYFFNSIKDNHPNNNFMESNEFLRENYSRPTNDVSDILSLPEESPSLGPFDYLPFRNNPSDPIDNNELYFNPNSDENNYDNELTKRSIERYDKMVEFMKTNNIKKFPFTTYKREES